jgi:hypothetical protein
MLIAKVPGRTIMPNNPARRAARVLLNEPHVQITLRQC